MTTKPKDKMGNDVDATNGTLTLLYYSEERFKSGKYIHLYYAPLMMCNIFVIGHYQSLRMKPKSIDASNDMSTDEGMLHTCVTNFTETKFSNILRTHFFSK